MKYPSSKESDKSQTYIDIDIWAEVFLMRLLGKPMLYNHGKRLIKTWKKILSKLANSIEKAIEKNVESDGLHKLRLRNYTEQLKKAGKKKNINPPDTILPLIGIIFELLGGMPDYSDRPRINRKSDYELYHLRSIEFRQNSYQKMRTILEASRQKPFYDQHRYDDLFDVYITKFNGNSDGFIKWYKKNYPQVYLEFFFSIVTQQITGVDVKTLTRFHVNSVPRSGGAARRRNAEMSACSSRRSLLKKTHVMLDI